MWSNTKASLKHMHIFLRGSSRARINDYYWYVEYLKNVLHNGICYKLKSTYFLNLYEIYF